MEYIKHLEMLTALKPYLKKSYIYRTILTTDNHPYLEVGDLVIFDESSKDRSIGKITLVTDNEFELIGKLSQFKDKLYISTTSSKQELLCVNPQFYSPQYIIKN